MATTPTCACTCPNSNADDSPLSTTANVVSLATFTYILIVGVWLRVSAFLKIQDEVFALMKDILDLAERASRYHGYLKQQSGDHHERTLDDLEQISIKAYEQVMEIQEVSQGPQAIPRNHSPQHGHQKLHHRLSAQVSVFLAIASTFTAVPRTFLLIVSVLFPLLSWSSIVCAWRCVRKQAKWKENAQKLQHQLDSIIASVYVVYFPSLHMCKPCADIDRSALPSVVTSNAPTPIILTSTTI